MSEKVNNEQLSAEELEKMAKKIKRPLKVF